MIYKNFYKKFFLFGFIILFICSNVALSKTNLLKNIYNSEYNEILNINDNIFLKFDEDKITNLNQHTTPFEGYTLYSSEFSTDTYLINNDGDILYTWESSFWPGHSVYLLENGNLLRPCNLGFHSTFGITAGISGGIQEIDLNNSVVWNFIYSDTFYVSHHDIEQLPNGNVLMIAWEYKTNNQAISAGRKPGTIPNGQLWPDYIIEVEPLGSDSGNIVWEWHVWDHLIQDYDPSKDNYGVVENHPELIDINYVLDPHDVRSDWLHSNSIDYNEEFDQILISVRNFNEIWVIDHSTTTEEAAGHTGGNSSKGGDILYRWGNPKAYKIGTIDDQKFFQQHDARWIESDYPGEGNILVFNNGYGKPGTDYSSVDEINPPIDEFGYYSYTPGTAYEPETPIWTYTTSSPEDFFSDVMGGTQRLPNGNTRICSSGQMCFFEVTPQKEMVWQYDVNELIFKIYTYPIDDEGIQQILPSPYQPKIPNGPTNGTTGISYTYTTNTTDPSGDQIFYLFDWGDGTSSDWIGPYESGENCMANNTWIVSGFFEIKVKARDNYNHESVWSESLLLNIEGNDPPYMPSNPDPADGETDVYINADLSWTGGDPDEEDTVTYDVYLEADDPTPDILVSDDQLGTTFNPGSMDFDRHYYWQIIATDNYGASTAGPIWSFITEEEPINFPPIISFEIPENRATDVSVSLIELSVYISDPEYDEFSWTIETVPDIGSSSGTYEHDGVKLCSISVILDFSKNYRWYVNAIDTESGYINEKVYIFTTIDNKPPNKPSINGPSSGKLGTSYTYKFTSTDPEGHDVSYFIKWGDGSITDWTTFQASGSPGFSKSHTWNKQDEFTLEAKAKDIYSAESDWATYTVTMPRNKIATYNSLFLRFLEQFPILQKILSYIL